MPPKRVPEMVKVIKKARENKKFYKALFADTKKTLDAWKPPLPQPDKDKLTSVIEAASKAMGDVNACLAQNGFVPLLGGDPPGGWPAEWTLDPKFGWPGDAKHGGRW